MILSTKTGPETNRDEDGELMSREKNEQITRNDIKDTFFFHV